MLHNESLAVGDATWIVSSSALSQEVLGNRHYHREVLFIKCNLRSFKMIRYHDNLRFISAIYVTRSHFY